MAIRTTCNLLTGDIIVTVIIFLVMICKLGKKTADSKGFQCVKESISEFSNYTMYLYVSPREGFQKVNERANIKMVKLNSTFGHVVDLH